MKRAVVRDEKKQSLSFPAHQPLLITDNLGDLNEILFPTTKCIIFKNTILNLSANEYNVKQIANKFINSAQQVAANINGSLVDYQYREGANERVPRGWHIDVKKPQFNGKGTIVRFLKVLLGETTDIIIPGQVLLSEFIKYRQERNLYHKRLTYYNDIALISENLKRFDDRYFSHYKKESHEDAVLVFRMCEIGHKNRPNQDELIHRVPKVVSPERKIITADFLLPY